MPASTWTTPSRRSGRRPSSWCASGRVRCFPTARATFTACGAWSDRSSFPARDARRRFRTGSGRNGRVTRSRRTTRLAGRTAEREGGAMAELGKVIAAAVQATPVFLDRDATVEKSVGLIKEAAAAGAGLIVFPETFIPTYPDWVWRVPAWEGASGELYAR